MTVKDRLAELQAKAGVVKTAKKSNQHEELEVRYVSERKEESELPLLEQENSLKYVKYYEQQRTIQEALVKSKNEISELKRLHDGILSSLSHDPKSSAKTDNSIKQITNILNNVAKQIKGLNDMAMDEHKNKKLSDTQYRSICTIVTFTLTNEFQRVMDELNEVRNTYEERCRKRVKRQFEIAGEKVDDEVIDETLASGTPVFLREYTECEAAKLALRDLQDRHNEIVKIEKSIREVRDLFLELSLMVSTQGELIDNVERNVMGAQCSVENGRTQLNEAQELRKSIRKKKLICIVLAVVFLIIIIAVVVNAILN